MTLVREDSRKSIIDRLKEDGIPVHYFVLTASRQTIHDRIIERSEGEDSWRMENLDMALELYANIPGSIKVDTDGVQIEKIAKEILSIVGNNQIR